MGEIRDPPLNEPRQQMPPSSGSCIFLCTLHHTMNVSGPVSYQRFKLPNGTRVLVFADLHLSARGTCQSKHALSMLSFLKRLAANATSSEELHLFIEGTKTNLADFNDECEYIPIPKITGPLNQLTCQFTKLGLKNAFPSVRATRSLRPSPTGPVVNHNFDLRNAPIFLQNQGPWHVFFTYFSWMKKKTTRAALFRSVRNLREHFATYANARAWILETIRKTFGSTLQELCVVHESFPRTFASSVHTLAKVESVSRARKYDGAFVALCDFFESEPSHVKIRESMASLLAPLIVEYTFILERAVDAYLLARVSHCTGTVVVYAGERHAIRYRRSLNVAGGVLEDESHGDPENDQMRCVAVNDIPRPARSRGSRG